MFIFEAYKLKVKNIECRTLYYIETEACQHLIVWPVNERRVHCPTTSLEPNQRVSGNQFSLYKKLLFLMLVLASFKNFILVMNRLAVI
jgi:hypothetical protein